MSELKQSWSIVILCYNEAGSIHSVVRNASEWLAKNAQADSEIIVVNDGSTDDSDAVIHQLIKISPEFTIRYILHDKNYGIGKGLKEGYSLAKMENVVMVPGDGQFNIDELTPHRTFKREEFIAFYRSRNEEYSILRRKLTALNRWVNKVLLNLEIRDVNWIKAYKNQSIKALDLKSKSSLIETEICAKLIAQGYRIVEVPSEYHQRTSGKSHGASWSILRQAIFDLPLLSWEVYSFNPDKKAS